jgi:hypothetical protein
VQGRLNLGFRQSIAAYAPPEHCRTEPQPIKQILFRAAGYTECGGIQGNSAVAFDAVSRLLHEQWHREEKYCRYGQVVMFYSFEMTQ